MLIMPVKIQNDLPAKARLEHENIFVMDETRAQTQNIRPLQILVLNLMPIKEETELQLLRSMSNTPLQIDVTFLQMKSHVSKNTSESHLHKFYNVIDDVRNNNYDGLIENMKNIIEINNMLDESLEVKLLNLYTPNSGYAVSMAAYNIEKNKKDDIKNLLKLCDILNKGYKEALNKSCKDIDEKIKDMKMF